VTKAASDNIRRWREHPAQFVREVFCVEPDPWQADVLEAFPRNPRLAMQACKGPGKTCLIAWLCWNFLCTRPYPKIAATSITADTLSDTLWAEMAKWQQKSPFLVAAFEWQKTRIFCKEHPETWFMSARSWSKTADATQQANTLAGLHADYIMFVLDEAGGIPDAVMAAAEAALSSCVEGHLVIAGNPTHLSGPLYRAATTERRLWHVTEITGDPDDPKRTPRVSVQWAREQIEKYGNDNPWVLINVFGRFPPSSLNVLIGPDEVSASFKRYYHESDVSGAPRVLGVDVAREGDDASVIAKRQGLLVLPLKKFRNIDGIQGAGQVSRIWNDWNAQAAFIDMTGGFGASWFDQLSLLGKTAIGVHFSSEAIQSDRYFNKRTEMYFECVEWIKRGGALPESPEIMAALTQTEYYFKGDRMILQPKEFIKQKIGFSPDETDAIVLTFAAPVSPTSPPNRARQMHIAASHFDPYASPN
jgi:phage terminase large subunit